MLESLIADVVFVQAFASRVRPLRPARRRPAPKLRPSRQHSDEFAHGLAEGRIAEPKLAMLAFHHFDESLRQRDRNAIALVAVPLKANQSQGHEGRKDRKAAVERVRNLALDIPVRLPRLRRQCSEQGRGARAFGR